MNKVEIIKLLAKEKKLSVDDAEDIVSTIIEELSNTLALGERVEFRGFGVFFTKSRKKRFARNPKTGEKIMVNEKQILQFKMSKHFFEEINK